MAIFKVLCLIGFLWLSSSCARKHEARHGSFQHSDGFHRYKHILKRRLSADRIFRQGPGSRRSERVEELSKVWLPTKIRIKETNSAFPNQPTEGHPNNRLSNNRLPQKGDLNKGLPNNRPVDGLLPSGKKPGQGGIESPVRPEGGQEPGKGGGEEPGQGGGEEPGQGGGEEPSQGGGKEPGQGGGQEPGQGGGQEPGQGGGKEPGQGGGQEPNQGGGQEPGQQGGEAGSSLQDLPSFKTFQSGKVSDGTSFKLNDNCRVTAKKTGTLYQLGSNPPDCINLAILLEKVLPKDKANFESTTFMTLEHIIIRSISLDTSTKGVEIAAAYTGKATLIKDILTVSNIRVGLSFVWTRSQKFTFDIGATFAVGSVPIDIRLIRNEGGK